LVGLRGRDGGVIEPWRPVAHFALSWHAMAEKMAVLLLSLHYYWFAIADLYVVFLYYHESRPRPSCG